jgi:hypothetical protein
MLLRSASVRRPTPEKNIETVPCWGKKISRRNASWTWDVTHDLAGGMMPAGKPCTDRFFPKRANAGRCWAADQHLLRSYKRFECNRDLRLNEVRCLE